MSVSIYLVRKYGHFGRRNQTVVNSGIPGVRGEGQRTFPPRALAHVRVPCVPTTACQPEAPVRQESGKVPPGWIRAGPTASRCPSKGPIEWGALALCQRHPTMSPLSGRSSSGGRTRLALHPLVSLCFRCGFCKQPPVGFCLLIQLDKYYSLVGALNPLLCNIIVDILRFEYTILFLLVFLSHSFQAGGFFPTEGVVCFESFFPPLMSLNI